MRFHVIGTAGHIDHGKSTLVHALTGIDPDRLKEEKARGITIELGFAHRTIGETTLAFVDVPGHERFVRTMLAGVGGIDFVMLIVAADESVMPQTREHFDICRLLGVPDGLVVMTKVDLVDEDTRALVALEIADLVKGSFLERAPIVEVSASLGTGLDGLLDHLVQAAARAAGRSDDGPARLPIDRVFSMHGFGTVVTGTLVAGRISAGDELSVEPSGRRVKVRGLQAHGRGTATAMAGQRAAVNLGGVDVADIARGETLASPGSLAVTRRADVALELLPGARALKHGARVHVHQGTTERLARVSIAGPEADVVAPGGQALARLRLEAPAALTRGDRLILRAYSPPMTIGAATILDPAPAAPGIRSLAASRRLDRLRTADVESVLLAMIDERRLKGLSVADAAVRTGAVGKPLDEPLARLTSRGAIVRAGEWLVGSDAIERVSRAVVDALSMDHRDHPLSDGLPREEARVRLFAGVAPAIFEAVIARLVGVGAIVDRDRLALPTHRAGLAQEDERALGAVEAVYLRAGLRPPDVEALPEVAGVTPELATNATTLLLRRKVLLKIGAVLVHREALDQLKTDMQTLKQAAGGRPTTIDVGQFKNRYGVSRKFAIPLLEYLDRERVTRRVGDARVLI